jgi:hypothetical protein
VAQLQLGQVVIFAWERMKDGMTRIVDGLPEAPNPMEEIEWGFSRREPNRQKMLVNCSPELV